MRCLLVADLHYSLPQFDWLVDAASLFDLVVLAGDALDVGSLVDFRAQSIVVHKYLARLARISQIILCSGNHDLDERGEAGEKIARWVGELRHLGIACDGDSVTIGDTLVTVCPWWDGPLVRAGIGLQLEAAAAGRSGRWIWVHHAPPANSPTSWTGSRHLGDVELREWIERYQPDIVLSGHVHQSPFVRDGSWFDQVGKTWVFNSGHQFGRPPAYVALDLDAGRVFWLSAAGQQYLDLDVPPRWPAARLVDPPEWITDLDRNRDPIPATGLSQAG
jgi:Icc-related predicted phosphoesterase